MNNWKPLTGRLKKLDVNLADGVAVRYNNGHTVTKVDSKLDLVNYDLSKVITHYQLINPKIKELV